MNMDIQSKDKEDLLEIIMEKNRRIQDLEKQVEDQKRLRLQDAGQVEEKAARIKEWVANKLEELEKQNKHLRDSNRRIKAAVESLRAKLAESRQDSPVYDCVTVEHIKKGLPPPPPPLHRSNKWELQLYDLADQTFSTILRQPQEEENVNDGATQLDSIESNSDKDASASRKSSSSLKNDLIALVKPSFTTIDGDQVVDSLAFEPSTEGKEASGNVAQEESLNYLNSSDQYSQPSLNLDKIRKESFNSCDNIEKSSTPMTPNFFDSPLRMRSGKDSILRTQSVKRNPAPEKLYDFISADLVKRGYLTKPGALKNHVRWFVLKNCHFFSYKSESEETIKATPILKLRLEPSCHVSAVNQSSDCSFPLKISFPDRTLQLIAETAQTRDEWIRILTVTINMSDIEPDTLTKHNSTYDGIVSVTRHGHTKRCHATLINHVIFFLKSLTDPTPMSYLSVKGSKIREVTDNYDYDFEEQELLKQRNNLQDCSLAIYPRYAITPDPVYVTLGSQQETDRWFYYLSTASGLDQYYGTNFERTLTRLMISYSVKQKAASISSSVSQRNSGCYWKDQSVMLYSDKPITQPLTSLPNETLRMEALELFKSILLFTQVPLEPVAIDYHVSLLQNCLSRFLKNPELRNEFYAQLIKQCTYILHRCNIATPSDSSDGYSPSEQRSSISSLSPSSSECHFITDIRVLDASTDVRGSRIESSQMLSQLNSLRERKDSLQNIARPTQSEVLQVMQILSVAVSLNLPRGRMRWWLMDYLRKFANPSTNIGKYALYTLKAIDRTIENGTRDNVPSRTEIMSVLLRNPLDHSSPHSLPVNFSDGSYLVIEADGSTTVEEFMNSMIREIDVRHSTLSDFYLFSDDPSGSKDLHILEPQRKVLDIVGWWEQAFRRNNSGRYQTTKVIKITCKKRLLLRSEEGETQQEKLLIVHQLSQEVVSRKIPLTDTLIMELAAIMAQLTYGNIDKSKDPELIRCILDKIANNFLPNRSSQQNSPQGIDDEVRSQLLSRWQYLSGRSIQDCARVYLNCIRRLKLGE